MQVPELHQWMLIYAKPRHELKLAKWLMQAGLEVYCPTIKTMRQWSDRKKKVEEPLFKSYLFINICHNRREEVYIAPGFSRFVYWLGKPVVVRAEVIEATKLFLDAVNHDTILHQKLKPGNNVKIIAGPLQNSEGKILEIKKNKARLQIDALGTIITAEVSLSHILA